MFLTKSSRNLRGKTPEVANFSGKFADWKLANLQKKNTTTVTVEE